MAKRNTTFSMRLSELEKKWLDEISRTRGVSAAGLLRMYIRSTRKTDKAKDKVTA
jgi:hypothetical protein